MAMLNNQRVTSLQLGGANRISYSVGRRDNCRGPGHGVSAVQLFWSLCERPKT